jgi:hypothetical protein
MPENVMPPTSGDEDEDLITFVNGALLDFESIDSALDALARDEAGQADQVPDESRGR